MGRLDVRVCEAAGLADIQSVGKPSPYAYVFVDGRRGEKLKSSVASRTVNPIWNDLFKLDVPTVKRNNCDVCASSVVVEIWTESLLMTDDLIGTVTVGLGDLEECVLVKDWYPVTHKGKTVGKVLLRMAAQDFGFNAAKVAAFAEAQQLSGSASGSISLNPTVNGIWPATPTMPQQQTRIRAPSMQGYQPPLVQAQPVATAFPYNVPQPRTSPQTQPLFNPFGVQGPANSFALGYPGSPQGPYRQPPGPPQQGSFGSPGSSSFAQGIPPQLY